MFSYTYINATKNLPTTHIGYQNMVFCNSTKWIMHIHNYSACKAYFIRDLRQLWMHTHTHKHRTNSQSINIYFSKMRTNLIWIDCLFYNEMYLTEAAASQPHTSQSNGINCIVRRIWAAHFKSTCSRLNDDVKLYIVQEKKMFDEP